MNTGRLHHHSPRLPRGLGLSEVVIALGLIAVLLPAGLAVLTNCFLISRKASDDTRSELIASTCFSELESIRREGSGDWFDEAPDLLTPTPEAPPLLLSFDSDGRYLGTVSPTTWEQGSMDRETRYLARIERLAAEEDSPALHTLSVTITAPARAPAGQRSSASYFKHLHLR